MSQLKIQDRRGVSRRQFLMASGGVTAAVLLAACGAPAASPGAEEGAAPAPAGQEINFLVRADIRSAYAMDASAEAWNDEFDQPVILDEPAGDPDVRIQSAQAAGDLIWDGFAVIDSPRQINSWVSRGLIQPLDDLIAVSSVPNAGEVIPAIIPSVLEASTFEGNQYTIPGNVGSVTLGWFWEPLEDAGLEPPETWDEVRVAAERIAETSPQWLPFDAACNPLCNHLSMIWGATDNPLTEEGLIDWTGEASVAALEWKQQMTADDLMPGVHTDSFTDWLRGSTAIMLSYDVHGTMAQQAFGIEAADTGLNITREKGVPRAGAPFWLNGSVVLEGASNPQGMIDFYLWLFGPDNETMGYQIANVAAKPAYQYTYEQFIEPNPDLHWQIAAIDQVRDSVPLPANLYWSAQETIMGPWIERAVDPRNDLSAAEAMESGMAELQEEIDRMLN